MNNNRYIPKVKQQSCCFLIVCMFAIGVQVEAQNVLPISYHEYMDKVSNGNLGFAAEKYNVNIADAQLKASKVFNDVSLSASYFNNQNNTLKMGEGVEVGISKTFTFGKRGAGISLAQSEKSLSEALLADYFRNLRADATVQYFDALRQLELYRVKEDAYSMIQQLAKGDSIRFSKGEIREIDVTQSRLEADIMANEVHQAASDLHNAYSALNLMMGTSAGDTIFEPSARLQLFKRDFMLADLLNASKDRADLVAAIKNQEVASRAFTMAKRERNTDVDLSLSVSRNGIVENEIAPAPRYTGVTLGVAFPLRLSNINKGSLHAARFRQQQAESYTQQTQLQVENEVMQAWRSYTSYTAQVKRYENGMLNDAKEVIDGKIYSYKRGEVSLIEVLDAQRTYDDVRTSYIEMLFNHASALVQLEKSSGIWDITL